MSIIKMKKVAVIGLDTMKEKLISELMELGVIQITDQTQRIVEEEEWQNIGLKDGDEDKVASLEIEINRLGLALETLEKYSTAKGPLFMTRKAIKKKDFFNTLQGKNQINKNIDYILGLNDQLHKMRERMNKRDGELSAIKPWVIYDLPLEVEETRAAQIHLGVVPSTVDMERLIQGVEANSAAVSVQEIHRDKDLIYLVAVTMREDTDGVLTMLKQHGYTPTPFKGFHGTATENQKRLIQEIEETEKQQRKIQEEIGTLLSMKNGIECMYDQLTIERDREKVKGNLIKTKRAFNLEGWVPVTCMEVTSKVLAVNDCYFEYRDPEENEEVPILISNGGFAYPFESIMEMYSLPSYRGIDPTKFYMIFYAMFFGIMLSDAGYGIIISIACFVILKKFPLEGMTYRMIKMFFYCGLATILWGALFGGWFGDFFQVAAKTLFDKEITIKPLWFNPIDDPTKLLIWSLIFGVIHIFFGLGIKAYMLIKDGKPWDAVFDVGSWYLVILGAAMWLGGGTIAQGLTLPGMIMTIVGGAMLLLTGGRKKKGFGKVIGGFSSLYDITGYLSDILSYARLLALGLATGVIASVVNLMGSLAGGGIFGAIVLIFAFVVGHTFNLAINALGAFVHSSRLQYIEFFGKFYEDGGEEFEPLRKNTKYVRLTDDADGGKK